jgi:hypothetical protein
MTNDERNLNPDIEDTLAASLSDDEMRYAPPIAPSEPAPEPDEEVDALEAELAAQELPPQADIPVTDGMDIEAALAAVSTLSDMLAEQEAAEQARIAQAEAEAQAAAERQARLEHPEQFFPVPPLSTLQRGQMASVIPALLLIVVGAWLTFTLTVSKTIPDTGLLLAVGFGGLGLTLLVRWLGSGRWTRGSLFGGLALLSSAAILFFLLQPFSPGLAGGWPLLLVGIGLSAIVTGLFAIPHERRLLLPGFALAVAGIVAFIVQIGVLGGEFINIAASLWPVALLVFALIWLLPLLRRQRR